MKWDTPKKRAALAAKLRARFGAQDVPDAPDTQDGQDGQEAQDAAQEAPAAAPGEDGAVRRFLARRRKSTARFASRRTSPESKPEPEVKPEPESKPSRRA